MPPDETQSVFATDKALSGIFLAYLADDLPAVKWRQLNLDKLPKEKREALDLWAAHLMRLVSGKPNNVIPMRSEVPA